MAISVISDTFKSISVKVVSLNNELVGGTEMLNFLVSYFKFTYLFAY